MADAPRGQAPPAEALARLEAAVRHVLEPAQRAQLVLEALSRLEPAEAYALIAEILRRRRAADSAFDVLRDTLHGLLLQSHGPALDYEQRSAIYRVAREHADEPVTRALRVSAPARDAGEGACGLSPRLSDVPLGRRRSLARQGDRHLLEELARDSDATVIANLLLNPRMREDDVVRMASLRPVAASTLVEIHRSSRWSPRERVRIALARNPYCPLDVALKSVGTLPLRTLREMKSDANLHPDLRQQVRDELERRASR